MATWCTLRCLQTIHMQPKIYNDAVHGHMKCKCCMNKIMCISAVCVHVGVYKQLTETVHLHPVFFLTKQEKMWGLWEICWHHHDIHMEADSEKSIELDCQTAAVTQDSKNGCLTSPPPSKISLTKLWTMKLEASTDDSKFPGYQWKAASFWDISGRQQVSGISVKTKPPNQVG